jgi:hypothetical protein
VIDKGLHAGILLELGGLLCHFCTAANLQENRVEQERQEFAALPVEPANVTSSLDHTQKRLEAATTAAEMKAILMKLTSH